MADQTNNLQGVEPSKVQQTLTDQNLIDIAPDQVVVPSWNEQFNQSSDPNKGEKPGIVPLAVGNDGRLYSDSPSTPSVPVVIPRVSVEGASWVFSGAFSVTDADTVAWGAGTLTTEAGDNYAIGASNTGNMSAKTYIYFDVDVSTTAFQTTTTASTAVGAGKILIAVAQNATGEAKYMVLNDNQYNIDASNIVANSITANELAASITYTGSLIIDSAGVIRSGQTDYNTGTGWWMGNAAGTPKFSIGNPSGNHLTWDGTTLSVFGVTSDMQTFTSSGTWTKPNLGSIAFIQCWGGGGSGGSGTSGGGGGGGGYSERFVAVSALGGTETVTIGNGGTAATNNNGNVGGDTTFGSHLTGYGGAGGGHAGSSTSGGGGGGRSSAGGAGGATTGGPGGSPLGGAGGDTVAGGTSVFGGGGGGDTGTAGGESVYGGGGGGGPGTAAGGASYYGGGGGGGDNGSAGGVSVYGGSGGAGGTSGVAGTTGSVPGGGGGGATETTDASGAGGKGKCIITVF